MEITTLNTTMKMVQRESNKWIVFISIVMLAFPSFGNSNLYKETHERLMNVNQNWVDLENEIEFTFTPNSEQELIQLHLVNVISYLENQSVFQLSEKQRENRLLNIEILKDYSSTGIFPINNLTSYRVPIFIDSKNTFCAVGFLMKENGLGQVAQEIAAHQLLSYLKDIEHAQLIPWQKSSGLSLFELALIQPTYGPPTPVCAAPSPIQWNKVNAEGFKITQLIEGDEDNSLYGISQLDDFGLKHEIKRYSLANESWTSIGNEINGQILEHAFCNNQMFISVFLPNEEFPHQLLKLNRKKWEKVAHFDGSVISIQAFKNKLYVLGNFKKTNDSIHSSLVVIDENSIQPFTAVGLVNRSFDDMKSSETALFLRSNGGVFKFQNDTLQQMSHIQYYGYFTSMTLSALDDTLYVSSPNIPGYNKYFNNLEHPIPLNNMMSGRDYPYHAVHFAKSKMINGNMVIAGDFRSSTLIPQINDNRKLVHCADIASLHWYGEGLIFHKNQKFYPILNEGIVLDFVELYNRIYILKGDGSICFAEVGDIEREVGKLEERVANAVIEGR